mgnify:CR=1 FL=1
MYVYGRASCLELLFGFNGFNSLNLNPPPRRPTSTSAGVQVRAGLPVRAGQVRRRGLLRVCLQGPHRVPDLLEP